MLRTLEGENLLHRDGDRWTLGDLEAAPVPALLRQVIAARVARLPAETARLLAVAAVVGQEVPLVLWAAVGEVAERALPDHVEPALATRLVVESPNGSGVRFAHALVREALYAGISALRRRVLHRDIAETLLLTTGADPDAVAYHLRQAGDGRAVAWLVRAGFRAHRAAAWLTAADRFVAAAGLAGEGEHGRERAWLLFAGAVLRRFGGGHVAARLLAEAERAALEAGERALVAQIGYQRGVSRCIGGDIRQGLAEIAWGMAVLESLPQNPYPLSPDGLALTIVGDLFPGTGGVLPAPRLIFGPG